MHACWSLPAMSCALEDRAGVACTAGGQDKGLLRTVSGTAPPCRCEEGQEDEEHVRLTMYVYKVGRYALCVCMCVCCDRACYCRMLCCGVSCICGVVNRHSFG